MIPIVEVESVLISSTGNFLLVNTSSGALAVRLVDGDGNALTSTTDGSKRYLDVKAILDNTINNEIVIKDPDTPENQLFVDPDGSIRIKQLYLSAANLRFGFMTQDQALTNGSYIDIYNNTSTGRVLEITCVFDNNNIDIKLIVDSVTVVEMSILDLYREFYMDGYESSVAKYVRIQNKGRIIEFNFAEGVEFETSFVIQAKANSNGYNLSRGLVITA